MVAEPKRTRTASATSAAASHKHKQAVRTDVLATAAPVEKTVGPSPVAPKQPVTFDQIEKLAYSYWEARNFAPGNPEEDWFRAERELAVLA